MKNYAVDSLVEALKNMSDTELRKLQQILDSPSAVRSLRTIVRGIQSLRESERKLRGSRTGVQPVERAAEKQLSLSLQGKSEKELREAFFAAFKDRHTYSSTRDVLATLNKAFGCKLSYNDFKKRGRRDAISRCWAKLKKRPVRERNRLLRQFFKITAHYKEEKDDYQELFRFLVNHE